jgi:hypothetical protein
MRVETWHIIFIITMIMSIIGLVLIAIVIGDMNVS